MATETPRSRPFVPSPFWLALLAAMPLVAGKAVHWGRPWAAEGGWRNWVYDLFVSAHADVAFAAGFGLVAFALLLAVRRWPRIERLVGLSLTAFGVLVVVYAVAAVQIFDFLRSPLTYTLLYLAGDMRSMRSSIGSFVNPGLVSFIVGLALVYVLAVRLASRPRAVAAGRLRRLTPTFVLLVAAGWGYRGAVLADGSWSDRRDVLIAKSPHWEFLSSMAEGLRGGAEIPALAPHFPREYLTDFTPRPPRVVPAAARPGRPRRPRNVIQVVLESTGARYLSLYGSVYPTTPNLVEASRHALVYDSFYSHAGFTANAMASMLLSVHPYMTWREYTQEYPDFPGTTVAELLRPRGYRTAFITSSYLDYVCMDCFLQNRGYDEVLDWKVVGKDRGAELSSWGGDEASLVDHTLDWVSREPGKPFYAVLWTQQSHHPYEPVAETPFQNFFEGQQELPPDDYDLGRYLNTVQQVDRQIGRLLAGLQEKGLAEDTIVIFTGDHGEGFGQPHHTWGHGFRVYDEGVRVPLVIWSPSLFPEGRRVGTVGGHVDINPTIADLLGLEAPESWEGRSLFAKDRPPRTYFYAANDDYLLGVREGDYKYIFNVTRGREELYDVGHDPEEQVNVAAAHPDRCAALRLRLAAWKHHAAGRLAEARAQMEAKRAARALTREASLR
jgi:lipoteichoic acid synthase